MTCERCKTGLPRRLKSKKLSLAHLFALIHALKPAANHWIGNEATLAIAAVFTAVLTSRGGIYNWTYSVDGVPAPHCIMSARDVSALRALSVDESIAP